MHEDLISREFYRLASGMVMPSEFGAHVLSQSGRTVAECLADALPTLLTKIEIPDSYALDERYTEMRKYQRDLPPETPPTSFPIVARTWRELSAATRLFAGVATNFGIFPCDVLIEGDKALVICDT